MSEQGASPAAGSLTLPLMTNLKKVRIRVSGLDEEEIDVLGCLLINALNISITQIMDREKDVLHKFLPIHINRIFIEHKNEAYIYVNEACDLIKGKLILVYKDDQGSS